MKVCIIKHISTSILSIISGIFVVGMFIPTISLAQLSDADSAFPYDIQGETYDPNTEVPTTDIATQLIKTDVTTNEKSIIQRLMNYFRVTGTAYNPSGTIAPATNYVKWILNMLLGLVSFLSLVMIIFAFYLIFFSKGDEAVGKARKILIGVGIALVIMGLSWFIASYFFDIYGIVTGTGI